MPTAARADVLTEAESFSIPNGASIYSQPSASGGRAVQFNRSVTISTSVTLGSAASALIVRAHGTQCAGSPRMVVSVDGSTVLDRIVSSSTFADYIAPGIGAGPHTIAVTYANWPSNCQLRTLRVDKVTFAGATGGSGGPGGPFTDELVASIASPTALAFTPDGRMLVAEQGGTLWAGATRALDLTARICANGERGLLGVAVDPQFASNGYVYLYYTHKGTSFCPTNSATDPDNRVSRFTMTGNVVDPSSELVLLDNIPSFAGNHNAGDVAFGKDGNLYVSVGDGGCDYAGNSGCAAANDAARDPHVLLGKILRITPTGGIPPDNPYTGAGTARCALTGRTTAGTRCQETYASGLRNPFRFAFDPNSPTTRFFINDVGQNTWEEVDEGERGADYGWNTREGPCATGSTVVCSPQAGLRDPIFSYGHTGGCASITGGAFVPNGAFGSEYDGEYLYGDIICGGIYRIEPTGSGWRTAGVLSPGAPSPTALTFGPGPGGRPALYYASYSGQVRRVRPTDVGNHAPTAAITASPTVGDLPLVVEFDGGGSSDPDGDALTYVWDFGDGSAAVETSSATVSHTYTTGVNRTATLFVRDPQGAASALVTVALSPGNHAPVPVIDAPPADARFSVGETLTLGGHADDPDEGGLAGSALTWEVIRLHATHAHPFLPSTAGAQVQFEAPAPEDLAAAENSALRIFLTATDSRGVARTVTQDLQPRKVSLTANTDPPTRSVRVAGETVTGSRTFTSWPGFAFDVEAIGAGFVSWSDGGAATHRFVTPAADSALTATFGPSAPTTVEGESFPLVSGTSVYSQPNASGGRALQFSRTATVQRTVSLAAPATVLVARAYGTQCGGAPQMVVRVDGATVLARTVANANWADYGVPVTAGVGDHVVAVTYPNGAANCALRTLRLDKLTFSEP